jgi:hypothetical protein
MHPRKKPTATCIGLNAREKGGGRGGNGGGIATPCMTRVCIDSVPAQFNEPHQGKLGRVLGVTTEH